MNLCEYVRPHTVCVHRSVQISINFVILNISPHLLSLATKSLIRLQFVWFAAAQTVSLRFVATLDELLFYYMRSQCFSILFGVCWLYQYLQLISRSLVRIFVPPFSSLPPIRKTFPSPERKKSFWLTEIAEH